MAYGLMAQGYFRLRDQSFSANATIPRSVSRIQRCLWAKLVEFLSHENWCSISLDTPMGDYILDENPKREITTVISDMKQVEPELALFEIPEGCKIVRADQSTPASNAKDSQSATSTRQ